MRAAEAVFAALAAGREGHDEPAAYAEAFRGSWVHDELYAVRNSRPAFRWGLLAGTVYSGIELWLRGRTPWTLRHRHADGGASRARSEEHTSELQSLMRTSYAVFCLNKQTANDS